MFKKYSLYFVLFLLMLNFSGCSSIAYFSHLAKGQFDLLWQRESVDALIMADDTPDRLRERLLLSREVRVFAGQVLHLPVGEAYSSYTDLGRNFVVWNVYAAPELSLDAYTWCYPLLGCMAYRGYYQEHLAQKAAEKLQDDAYEVKVGGVRAYSTLGYFDDPLLNTFLFIHEASFIELLIHELAHRKLFIKDDTAFNENFATAVGLLGTEQWYTTVGRRDAFTEYRKNKDQYQILITMLLACKQKLELIYNDEAVDISLKRQGKAQLLQDMHEAYIKLKEQHAWDDRYDNWVFNMNNASFATLSNYEQWVPSFLKLFEKHEGDWQAFYLEVETLSRLNKTERQQVLDGLNSENLN